MEKKQHIDTKAYLELYEAHVDALFRHAYFRLRDREEAKDLIQEVFLRFWEVISRGREIYNPKAFLYRIANNRIIDLWRKKGTNNISLEALQEEGFDVPEEETTERLIAQLDGARAFKKIADLPPLDQSVIIMRFSDGLGPKEIAEITGESENVISVRTNRALKRLRILTEQ